MAALFTPKQLTARGELFHQLATMLGAGIALPAALAEILKNKHDRDTQRALESILKDLRSGGTFTESLKSVIPWASPFDISMIEAGEQSGRLDSCCALITQCYENRASIVRVLITNLTYPAFIVHMASCVFPLPGLVTDGDFVAFSLSVLMVLTPVYLVSGFIIYMSMGNLGPDWKRRVERVFGWIPLLGKANSELALARLSAALEALVTAGVPIIQAWQLAVKASGSVLLIEEIKKWERLMENGSLPSSLVYSSKSFPDMYRGLYKTGEVSGQLDDALTRLQKYYQEEGTRHLKGFASLLTNLIFAGVAGFIGYKVINYYLGYFEMINELSN
jgi:type IV pilus assembly protein PilC